MDQVCGPLSTVWEIKMEFLDLALAWHRPGCCINLEKEPAEGRPPSFSIHVKNRDERDIHKQEKQDYLQEAEKFA